MVELLNQYQQYVAKVVHLDSFTGIIIFMNKTDIPIIKIGRNHTFSWDDSIA